MSFRNGRISFLIGISSTVKKILTTANRLGDLRNDNIIKN